MGCITKGHEFRDKLESRGFVKIHRINTGTKRGYISVVELNERAYEWLKSNNIHAAHPAGIGNIIHKYWQHQIRRWYVAKYKNCKVIIEDTTYRRVDVAVYFSESRTAVEVCIENNVENEIFNNISQDLKYYNRVIWSCLTEDKLKSLKERVEKELGQEILKRVWFKQLGEFGGIGASPSSPVVSGSAHVETGAENPLDFL